MNNLARFLAIVLLLMPVVWYDTGQAFCLVTV
jgi:hypothetical protein